MARGVSCAALDNAQNQKRRRGGMKVQIHSSLEQVGVDRWNQLMVACGAPVFYYSSFLTAFERLPLHAVREAFYVVGVGDDGELQFGFPAFLLADTDPMRVLA